MFVFMSLEEVNKGYVGGFVIFILLASIFVARIFLKQLFIIMLLIFSVFFIFYEIFLLIQTIYKLIIEKDKKSNLIASIILNIVGIAILIKAGIRGYQNPHSVDILKNTFVNPVFSMIQAMGMYAFIFDMILKSKFFSKDNENDYKMIGKITIIIICIFLFFLVIGCIANVANIHSIKGYWTPSWFSKIIIQYDKKYDLKRDEFDTTVELANILLERFKEENPNISLFEDTSNLKTINNNYYKYIEDYGYSISNITFLQSRFSDNDTAKYALGIDGYIQFTFKDNAYMEEHVVLYKISENKFIDAYIPEAIVKERPENMSLCELLNSELNKYKEETGLSGSELKDELFNYDINSTDGATELQDIEFWKNYIFQYGYQIVRKVDDYANINTEVTLIDEAYYENDVIYYDIEKEEFKAKTSFIEDLLDLKATVFR